jgi:hypothetical protein
MTSSSEPPEGSAGPHGRRRPPTIDLKATEVGGDQTIIARIRATATALWGQLCGAVQALPRPEFSLPLAVAGGAGIVLTLLVLALAGVFSGRDEVTAIVDTRLARVEQQLKDLAGKPMPAASASKAIDELAGRLARLETVVATPRPPIADPALANRIATLEGDIRALGERIGVLARRSDEVASTASEARARADAAAAALGELRKFQPPAVPVVERAEIETLLGRIAALERAAKALEAQLAARTETGTDRALRLLVVASALNTALERGVPFVAELAAAKAVSPDPKLLAVLDPLAQSGVPSTDTLARELVVLVPILARSVGTTPREGGILDRLKANAEKIVRVRPIDDEIGDDPVTVVRRIEARAEQRNVAGAIVEIAKLPPAARALTTEWVGRVEARNAAIDAGRRFVAGALAAIAKPSL